jgi:Acetyltransferase (GNAT) family
VRGDECEVVTIRSLQEGQGIGRALLDAVRDAAIDSGCRRLWLITTNNNLRALRLYQRWGMDIVAFHRNAVSDARRRLKPSIPERDADGIPFCSRIRVGIAPRPKPTPPPKQTHR